MRAVLFEGTPKEFETVEAMFRAGADPALQIRSVVLRQARPKAWPELDEEQCHRLARRVLERAPASLVEALSTLAEAQNLSGEQTLETWADYANRLPEELGGTLAELARCASRTFIELYGCENAPQRVKGAACMLVQRVRSEEGVYLVIRPGLMRAMAEFDLLDPLPSELEQSTDAEAADPVDTGVPPRSSPPANVSADATTPPPTGGPPAAPKPKASTAPEAPRSGMARPPRPQRGILDEVARFLSPLSDDAAGSAVAEGPTPAAEKPERDPFSLFNWSDSER